MSFGDSSSLGPYVHEIAANGICYSNCEACEYYRRRGAAQREQLKYPPKAIILTDADMKLLHGLRITWFGDNRD